MFFDSHDIPKDIELWTHTNLQLHDFKLIFDVEASDPCITKSWPEHACQLSDQSCFTSSIWTKKTKQLSVLNHQANIFIGYFWWPPEYTRIDFSNVLRYERVFGEIALLQSINFLSFIFCILVFVHEFSSVFVDFQVTVISEDLQMR